MFRVIFRFIMLIVLALSASILICSSGLVEDFSRSEM